MELDILKVMSLLDEHRFVSARHVHDNLKDSTKARGENITAYLRALRLTKMAVKRGDHSDAAYRLTPLGVQMREHYETE